MNSEYIIDKEEIREINERYGGSLRSDAEIDTALQLGRGKAVYRKIAYLWRAILVGRPFTDGNKRTALMVALRIIDDSNIEMDDAKKGNLASEIIKIARENIVDISRIERLIRYAVTGD